MTQEEADQIVMLLAAATGGRADPASLEYFAVALTKLDYKAALSTATIGKDLWRFFPSWAEFKEIYKIQVERLAPKPSPAQELPPVAKGKQIPTWVRRWVAARFLYMKFGKEKDVRPFPEQEGWCDPQAEKMPPDAWVEEAKHIADTDVWAAISDPGK